MYFSRLVSKMTSSRRTQNAACARAPAITWQRAGQRGEASIGAPIGRYPIVIVDLDLAAAVAPVELLIGSHRRCALQFRLGQVEMIGAEHAIVGQPRPGNRRMLLSHAEKAAEAEH